MHLRHFEPAADSLARPDARWRGGRSKLGRNAGGLALPRMTFGDAQQSALGNRPPPPKRPSRSALLESTALGSVPGNRPSSWQKAGPSKLSTARRGSSVPARLCFAGTLNMRLRWGRQDLRQPSGPAPACANEWRAGVCEKPRIKCGDCSNRLLIPMSDAVIYDHLAGKHVVGVYPLLEDDTCYFLAADFDEADWRDDARAFMQSCPEDWVFQRRWDLSVWNGAHAPLFSSPAVFLLVTNRHPSAPPSSLTMASRTQQLKLESLDRLFLNQDTMPKGSFQQPDRLYRCRKASRAVAAAGCSTLTSAPYPDQWGFLASVRPMPLHDIEPTIVLAADGGVYSLDDTFTDDEEPWRHPGSSRARQQEAGRRQMPKSLTVTLANLINFRSPTAAGTGQSPDPSGSLQEPRVLGALAIRISVWGKPRVSVMRRTTRSIALPSRHAQFRSGAGSAAGSRYRL